MRGVLTMSRRGRWVVKYTPLKQESYVRRQEHDWGDVGVLLRDCWKEFNLFLGFMFVPLVKRWTIDEGAPDLCSQWACVECGPVSLTEKCTQKHSIVEKSNVPDFISTYSLNKGREWDSKCLCTEQMVGPVEPIVFNRKLIPIPITSKSF